MTKCYLINAFLICVIFSKETCIVGRREYNFCIDYTQVASQTTVLAGDERTASHYLSDRTHT